MKTICFRLLIYVLLLVPLKLSAQIKRNSGLYLTIRHQDSILFDVGFNTCDTVAMRSVIHPALEFYHDEGGVTITSDTFITGFRLGICNLPYRAIRRANRQEMEVFPMYKNGVLYGAVQNGFHSFYAIDSSGKEALTGKARFSHLWLLIEGKWLLFRVLSYDHRAAQPESAVYRKKSIQRPVTSKRKK